MSYLSTQSFGIHSWNENSEDVVAEVEVRQSHKEFTQTLQCHSGKVLMSRNFKKSIVTFLLYTPSRIAGVGLVHCLTLPEVSFSPFSSFFCCHRKHPSLLNQLRKTRF